MMIMIRPGTATAITPSTAPAQPQVPPFSKPRPPKAILPGATHEPYSPPASTTDVENVDGECPPPDSRSPQDDMEPSEEDPTPQSDCFFSAEPRDEFSRLITCIESRIAFLEKDHIQHRGWSTQLDRLHDSYLEGLRMFVNKGTRQLNRAEASDLSPQMEPLKIFGQWSGGQESPRATVTCPLHLTIRSSDQRALSTLGGVTAVFIHSQGTLLNPIKQVDFFVASPLTQALPECARFTEINDHEGHPEDHAPACPHPPNTRDGSLKRPRDPDSPPSILLDLNKKLKSSASDQTLDLLEGISTSALRSTPPPSNHQADTGIPDSSAPAATPTPGSAENRPTPNQNFRPAPLGATPTSSSACPPSTPPSSNPSLLSVAAATMETPETGSPPATPLTDILNDQFDASAETPTPEVFCPPSTPLTAKLNSRSVALGTTTRPASTNLSLVVTPKAATQAPGCANLPSTQPTANLKPPSAAPAPTCSSPLQEKSAPGGASPENSEEEDKGVAPGRREGQEIAEDEGDADGEEEGS
ncbi:hypothetical protein PCANC_06828 [Puccinia coronata f. sp. avenae]|uniref:Uncharacterized protein n=1 Tax=Puccinia coronata f. sp. avenae TaxID=200324 RepID=A0A2N5VVG2_9BASI|nr:hypothetical protein PCANC_06828 [Puccinia coronata f. sp. avenae]